jgi:ubiquinone/menaquinone biosynthesis C-methylase UbiE
VRREVRGRCLDFGCGRHDRFIRQWCGGDGEGIDVFPYAGLRPEQIVRDPTRLRFADASFGTVTFIANLNHVPRSQRDAEILEAHRVLEPGGRIVVTMGHPLAEYLVHKLVAFYDRALGTHLDVDGERGMGEEEAYSLRDAEIVERLRRAGFGALRKKRFWTQWGLNHLWVGTK